MTLDFLCSDSENLLSKRDEIRKLQVRCHLETSGYDPASLAHQISDLPVDFPGLYDDHLFEQHTVIVAISSFENNKVVGCVGAAVDDEDPSISSLAFLAVDPEYRRQGIAARLVDAIIQKCIDMNKFSKIQLITLRGIMHPACKLYESRGFRLYKQQNGASQSLDLFHVLYYEKELKLLADIHREQYPEKIIIECDVENLYPDNIDDVCPCKACCRLRLALAETCSCWPGKEETIQNAL
jgi:ribosomal protein S18 acetylase RimI-like enzyme